MLAGNYYKLEMPDVVIGRFCRKNQIPLVPLFEDMQQSRENLYWPVDRHMNESGQRVAASSLLRQLSPIMDGIVSERLQKKNSDLATN